MSRFHPDWNIEPIFEAAEHWKQVALLRDGSVLSQEVLWTNENIDAINEYFVKRPDAGQGNFLEKLKGQLEPTSAETKKLMAELLWFMLLCPSNIGPESKRETIEIVWKWSLESFPGDSAYLTDEILRGIGSGGTGYNTQRWREVVFFIRFLRAFRAKDTEERRTLLSDGWRFAEWIQGVPEADARQLRHMILYLLFPDSFDRIFGRADRRNLLKAFTDMPQRQIYQMSALDMSREIQRIRGEEEERIGRKDIDFYLSPLLEKWEGERVPAPTITRERTEFDKQTMNVEREHILAAIQEIDRNAYPADARSSTYDLIHGTNRYPPKYVLSLAVKHASGEVFPRSFFTGGEDSRAFRLLRDKGFSIERKDFVRELVQEFLTQANEATSQVTKNYPKRYRDLEVKVGLGQGRFARIPWISYTGYGQTTSDGIYPVILYFKSVGILIVAYGISETHQPEIEWHNLGAAQIVAEYLQEQHEVVADRYGISFIHQGFDLNEEVDFDGIEKALDEVIGKYHEQFAADLDDQRPVYPPYTPDDALRDLFIEESKFTETLQLLGEKKNLILQGPPGVGKTFACKRLAFALMGEKDEERLGMVQFHQSYSYEDFIQGYRPSGTGFRLKNGIFYEFCDAARNDPGNDYVFIIDELNRGNLSKVFGELMLLIETDKRGPDWAIPLAYSEEDSPKFYIPENLYLIGLMNTADRSLAMVDYALRRRFAFARLTPGFETDQFFDFMTDKGASSELIGEIVERMGILNAKIADDTTNLGPGFCVGHSFFCSIAEGLTPDWDWYARVIKSEIAPLLREYYFDATKQADDLVEGLLRHN